MPGKVRRSLLVFVRPKAPSRIVSVQMVVKSRISGCLSSAQDMSATSRAVV